MKRLVCLARYCWLVSLSVTPFETASGQSIRADGVRATFDTGSGQLTVVLDRREFPAFTVAARPFSAGAEGWEATVTEGAIRIRGRGLGAGMVWTVRVGTDSCLLGGPGWEGAVDAEVELLAARVATVNGQPATHVFDDVFETAFGRASNRRMNIVYSIPAFWGLQFAMTDGATPDLRPVRRGYAWRTNSQLEMKVTDLWPVLAWRRQGGYTFGRESPNGEYVVPREWFRDHRPFPWPRFSPVQLPFISMSDPKDWERTKEQLDFVARELRDYGFFCYGEWPLTQYYPEYDPALQPAFLAGNRRTCEYAHKLGLKVLRWVTDPDIQPSKYPELHKQFLNRGWFSPSAGKGRREWLLDYSNPAVQDWIAKQYALLASAGPDFYWIDNNHPTQPLFQPDLFAPDAFRLFYQAIQRGLLSTGRNDILMRSGASAWAIYSGVGILDVYAPGPDIQNSWREQQVSAAANLTRIDYLCHYNFWRRGLDDFFPAGPQSIDQTRAMACLLALTGIGFTTTDIGLPNIPRDRLELLRQIVPIATIRPLDLYRFRNSPAPRVWVLNVLNGEFQWQVLAVFNWGLRSEQRRFISLADLGLDPDGHYLLFDFFSQQPLGIVTGGIGCRVAPGSARAIAIHPVRDTPFLVSTDRHITQGAADIEELEWNPATGDLSGVFVAGVTGRTYHLTVYEPPGWRFVRAAAGGGPANVTRPSPRLLRVSLQCQSESLRWQVKFRPGQVPEVPPREPVGGLPTVAPPEDARHDAHSVALVDLRDPGVRKLVLGNAQAWVQRMAKSPGTAVVIAPPDCRSDVRELQELLYARWGVGRNLAGDEGGLLVSLPAADRPDDLLFRSSSISFALSQTDAIVRQVGRRRVVVVSPYADEAWLQRCVLALQRDPDSWVAARRAAWDRLESESTSWTSGWSLESERRQASARIQLAPNLRGKALSFHLDRRVPSLASRWGVPEAELTLNGRQLPHLLNPCRPHSPPRNFDRVYFTVPAGAARFDSPNELVIAYKGQPKDSDRLLQEFRRALELRIETPGEVGRNELSPLPDCVVLPAPRLLALLGAAGSGDVIEDRVLGIDYEITGATPYRGWPQGPGRTNHCVFADDQFTVSITVPRGSSGVVSVYAYDADAYRKESIAFENAPAKTVSDFGAGIWLDFPFTTAETADGKLVMHVKKIVGANCVLSKLRVTLGGER